MPVWGCSTLRSNTPSRATRKVAARAAQWIIPLCTDFDLIRISDLIMLSPASSDTISTDPQNLRDVDRQSRCDRLASLALEPLET